MHYVKTILTGDIWLISNVSEQLDDYITERYAAPTVEEMMIEMAKGKETTEALDEAFTSWIRRGNEDLKEALVKAFKSLKERN